jgi:hypothetical protein
MVSHEPAVSPRLDQQDIELLHCVNATPAAELEKGFCTAAGPANLRKRNLTIMNLTGTVLCGENLFSKCQFRQAHKIPDDRKDKELSVNGAAAEPPKM